MSGELPPPLAGLRVALVHDWLTGMRGGEKCLEVLCRVFPDATLYTLIHRRGSLSPAIESMAIRTSPLQRIPGVFRYYRHLLPFMPLAVRCWRLKDVDLVISLSHCVAKAVVPPPGVPHVCYCFTPMRYAWQGRDAYLESWTDRPVAAAARPDDAVAAEAVGSSDGQPGHAFRGDLGDGAPADRAVLPARQPRDPATRERRVLLAGCRHAGRATMHYLVVSALVPYKRIDQAVAACTRSGRR